MYPYGEKCIPYTFLVSEGLGLIALHFLYRINDHVQYPQQQRRIWGTLLIVSVVWGRGVCFLSFYSLLRGAHHTTGSTCICTCMCFLLELS